MPAWIDACAADDIEEDDAFRFDHAGRTVASYRTEDNPFYASDRLCTHEHVPLADGLLMARLSNAPSTMAASTCAAAPPRARRSASR